MTSATNEKTQASHRDAERLEEGQKLDDLKWLMSHESGRRIMIDLLERAKVFELSMTGNSWTFFNEGRRSLGNMFFADVTEHCPDEYLKMMNESREAKQRIKEITDAE